MIKIQTLFIFIISVERKDFRFSEPSYVVSVAIIGLEYYQRKNVDSASWKDIGELFTWIIFKKKIF